MSPGLRPPLITGVVALLAGIAVAGDGGRAPVDRTSVHDFLGRHWRRPLAPQGAPPPGFSALETSLAPESCGTCHPAQHADWRATLHAKSMGPGGAGRGEGLLESDPESARLCRTCHAPLAEQQPGRRTIFDARLMSQGIVCAACHVREHRRFGPPRREPLTPASSPSAKIPHGGAIRTPAFLASEFCASCHQFGADGLALNDKPLENTYEEWRATPPAPRAPPGRDR